MTYLHKYKSASRMAYGYSSKYLQPVFTYWLVFLALVCSPERANCANEVVVNRLDAGDRFTNPFYADGERNCANIHASCFKGSLKTCSECVCNQGKETYRSDLKQCISEKKLNNFTGCRYRGIQDVSKELMDNNLPTLDFTKSKTKDIFGLLHIAKQENPREIKCEIQNSTSYLDSNGKWIAFSNISDILSIAAYGNVHSSGNIDRYLTLRWEGVKEIYSGLLMKLQISCRTNADPEPESDCFAFKTQGKWQFDSSSLTKTTVSTKRSYATEEITDATTSKFTNPEEISPTVHSTQGVASTEKSGINHNYHYSVSMPVIIGVSAGVGLVILIIIISAVCFVRRKTRKHPEDKPSPVNTEVPKVHFTAQARFSLIQEAVPVDDEDYTSLKENRESYDPYCSLRKDDVDLDVIDNILKDAVSMESMSPSSEPRYSCHMQNNGAIVIESVQPHSPRLPKYHVLEIPDDDIDPGEVTDPDYEEVDTSDDDYPTTTSRLLDTAKPPLPDRVYHELEPPSNQIQSEC